VVSLSTVKYHISNILAKLGVENRVAAVTLAIQKKLI
jgi:DNA-binding NarL/FixJ family response regulator